VAQKKTGPPATAGGSDKSGTAMNSWESHGREGWLERHSGGGGRPPFPCKFSPLARFHRSAWRRRSVVFSTGFLISVLLAVFVNAAAASTFEEYEGRQIRSIEIIFEGSPADPAAQADFLSILTIAPNTEFSAVSVRDSLQALFLSERVANARVEVFEEGTPKTGPLRLRFVIARQVQIGDVKLDLVPPTGTPISEDELRARLNLTQPGTRLSRQIILRNSDELQVYLRDRGYFNAVIETAEQLDTSGTRATVTYKIVPGEQSRVAVFNIDITGFDPKVVRSSLLLQPGAPFTREALGQDTNRIRQALIDQAYLSPSLEDARVERDPERNEITISLKGVVGPKVSVVIKDYPVSEKTARELLPVKREGNIDQSAIVEGSRRLRNKFQEDGYFFAEVTPWCTVTPPTPELGENGTPATCENLNPETLTGSAVEIRYEIERGRRLKLTDIRIIGTRRLTLADVAADLRTQKASAVGLIPFIGYGRGYTSLTLLEQDRRTIDSYMRDLGYRRVKTDVLQGVSIDGESLIITFQVSEGPLTRIAGAEVRGNKIYTDQRLQDQLQTVVGAPYSRSQARADGDRVLALYAREGYVNAQIEFSIVELPKKGDDEQVRLLYSIVNEGDKVYVNRIVVNGVTGSLKTMQTKRDAILRVIPLAAGDVLRADRIAESERDLYLTDAYRQVIIRTEPAGETSSGFKRRDVIIDVEEKKPRVMDYGGGFSTDTGALGLLEITNAAPRQPPAAAPEI
jgi:outer membrane protein assembly factor BamA